MLAQIHKTIGKLSLVLVIGTGFLFVSCATEKHNVALVDDPSDEKGSSIPWNKQEKWENSGPLNGVTDRR